MDSNTTFESGKKALEELSQEELIKKCKGLLAIAHKAKQAKDVLQEENNEIKNKLTSDLNKQNETTTEIIENLTQQKLLHVTTIEDLKTNLQKTVKELEITKERNNVLDNENLAFKHQISRITDENEQLIIHLEILEKEIEELKRIGLEQQTQLLDLEKNNTNQIELENMLARSLEEVKKLQSEKENLKINLGEKDKSILIISEELKGSKIILNNLSVDKKKLELSRKEMADVINLLKKEVCDKTDEISKTRENIKEKFKFYHSKLVKFSINIKQLKEDKNVILNLFKSYINQVKDWKNSLSIASENFNKIIDETNVEIKELRNENEILKENNAKFIEQLKAHKTDDEKSKEFEEIELIRTNNTKLTEENKNYKELLDKTNEKIIELMKQNKELSRNYEKLLERPDLNETETQTEEDKKTEAINENRKLKEEINNLNAIEAKNKEFVIMKEDHKKTIEELNNYKKLLNTANQKIVELVNNNRQLAINNEKLLEIPDLNENETQTEENYEESKKIHVYKMEIDELHKEVNTYKKLSDNASKEILKLINKNKELTEKLLEMPDLNENETQTEENNEECEKLQDYKMKITELHKEIDNYKQLSDKASKEILQLVNKNKELTEKLLEMPDLNEIDTQTDLDNSEEIINNLKRENIEVLTEMNEMNQVLKERGETISKLQIHCDEIMKKLQIYETQANKNVDNITQKEELIRDLQQQLDDLKINQEKEIEYLKDKLENSYAESETMSTSTISRQDECNRLKELEGSWEERYGKLRSLAIKLKAKVKELTMNLVKEKEDKNELQQKNLNTIATLQTQIDNLQDNLEIAKKESNHYLNKLDTIGNGVSNDKKVIAENEELIIQLKGEIDDLKKDKINMDNWKKQISIKVQTFRKELEANKLLKKDYEERIMKLTQELEEKEKALKLESDCHKQTKTILEQSNNERKKNSVLNLEMQDYERSVKDLSFKLNKKQDEIMQLKNQIDTQKTTVNALREQNKLQEERVNQYENESITITNELQSYKRKIIELEDLIVNKDEKIQDLMKLLENSRSEIEELSTELSKVIKEHQKTNNSLRNEKDVLINQNLGFQQNLRETQDLLRLKQDELTTIRNDYENYKVRAQSVLRQNQNRDVGIEEKLNEEMIGFKEKCHSLTLELNEIQNNLDKLKGENVKLKEEKEDLIGKLKDCNCEIEDLKCSYQQLSNKHQQAIMEHGETVRNLKIHAETLSQCYRQQLTEQENRFTRDIVELQNKLDKVNSPPLSLEMVQPPPPIMLAREDGEGSESVENTNGTRSNSHPIPLERLLDDSNNGGLAEYSYVRKQLLEQENKVTHLTELLADTEQDLAKHVQMNKLLKEEIRRQQRSVEREKHAENLEYLKNVVFKFVTLGSGDEKTRLVPVLNTILKLSPEETEKLTMVAKGEQGIRGWASAYLWSQQTK